MALKTFEVDVTQRVKVTVDEDKFTPKFMEEFRESFYPFYELKQHVEHLAQLTARGGVDPIVTTFIEGYGATKEMGIKVDDGEVVEIEVLREVAG